MTWFPYYKIPKCRSLVKFQLSQCKNFSALWTEQKPIDPTCSIPSTARIASVATWERQCQWLSVFPLKYIPCCKCQPPCLLYTFLCRGFNVKSKFVEFAGISCPKFADAKKPVNNLFIWMRTQVLHILVVYRESYNMSGYAKFIWQAARWWLKNMDSLATMKVCQTCSLQQQ